MRPRDFNKSSWGGGEVPGLRGRFPKVAAGLGRMLRGVFWLFLLHLAHIRRLACAALALVMARKSFGGTIPLFLALLARALTSTGAVAKLAIGQILDQKGTLARQNFGFRSSDRNLGRFLRIKPCRTCGQKEQD